jgi:hypothetical protein
MARTVLKGWKSLGLIPSVLTALTAGGIWNSADPAKSIMVVLTMVWLAAAIPVWLLWKTQASLPYSDINYNRIVPDAGLMRLANSLVIPNDIKRELARLLLQQGELRFGNLLVIDDRLQAQQYAQQAQRYLRRKRCYWGREGAIALQAVLNDAKD